MSSLATVCDAAMEKDGVLGVMCVDGKGLYLHSAGAVPEAKSGVVAAISAQCLTLLGADAVATIESPQSKVLLTRCDEAAVALFMRPAASAPAS